MKVREVIRLLEDNGWFKVATKGSHMQYKHPMKTGRVTIAGKRNDDCYTGLVCNAGSMCYSQLAERQSGCSRSKW